MKAKKAAAMLVTGLLLPTSVMSIAGGGKTHQISDDPDSAKLLDSMIERDIQDAELAFLNAKIKTEDDLNAYLKEVPEAVSPLSYLSPGAKRRFLESLVFTPNGLGGYYYGDLEAELTPTQIYQILSLFGAQRTTMKIRGAHVATRTDAMIMAAAGMASGDYLNYKCTQTEAHVYNCQSLNPRYICNAAACNSKT